MAHPDDRTYSKDHEWVAVDGDIATIGISEFAQDQLGEVVYVDLPSAGGTVSADESFGEIESVKSVSELVSPVSGEIVDSNGALSDSPETVNSDPYGAGWMIKVRMSDPSELATLLSAEEYDAFITEG
ncbi:MAG: glycine cleavage system protein GcvH [Coriobacteriia bacterium]